MTWKERQQLGLCCQAGCDERPVGQDLCVLHLLEKRWRNRFHMQFKRRQLGLPLSTIPIRSG